MTLSSSFCNPPSLLQLLTPEKASVSHPTLAESRFHNSFIQPTVFLVDGKNKDLCYARKVLKVHNKIENEYPVYPPFHLSPLNNLDTVRCVRSWTCKSPVDIQFLDRAIKRE